MDAVLSLTFPHEGQNKSNSDSDPITDSCVKRNKR